MIDFARDKNKAMMYQIAKAAELPSFVKTASLMEEENFTKLNTRQFADEISRMYPISNKAETWMSAAYIQKQASSGVRYRSEVMSRIQEACSLWDIDYGNIQTTQPMQKQASSGIRIEYRDDNGVHAAVSVEKEEDLQKVANDVLNPRRHTYHIRRNVARQILTASDVLGHNFTVGTRIDLEKTAGYATGSIESVKHAIAQRRVSIDKTIPHHVESMNYLDKVASEEAASTGIVSPITIDKIAAVLDAVDRQAGLCNKYNDTFTSPEKQMFEVTLSQIDGYKSNMVKLANNRYYMANGFNHRNVTDFLLDVFGKEASTSKDLRNTMEKLSSSDADVLCKFIDKCATEYTSTLDEELANVVVNTEDTTSEPVADSMEGAVDGVDNLDTNEDAVDRI